MSWAMTLKRILKRRSGRAVLALVLVGAVLGLLALAIVRDWGTIVAYDWRVNVGYLLLVVVLHSASLWLIFIVWHWMVAGLGKAPDVWTNFQIYALSTVARRVPTPLWFLGARLYLYRQHSISGTAILTTTALEMGLMILGGCASYIIVLPAYVNAPGYSLWPLMALVVGLFAVLLVRPRTFVDLINFFLRRFNRQPIQVHIRRTDLIRWSAIHVSSWFIGGTAFYFLVKAVTDTTANLPSLIAVTCLATLVGLMSQVLPSGLGIKELTLGSLLSVWMPLSVGLVVSIVYRITLTLVEMCWVLVAFFSLRRTSKGPNPVE